MIEHSEVCQTVVRVRRHRLSTIWHLGVLSVWTQLALALVLLRREYARRLAFGAGESGVGLPVRGAAMAE
ncbi:MAG: hypothetical protein M3Z10_05360 [Gemmatimonadota bacterium]|nr:hypothetical protein [Gemmatimonadota bacterium]